MLSATLREGLTEYAIGEKIRALRVSLTPEPGTLVCFRAETTHEVLPVTHGERFTIVSWYL